VASLRSLPADARRSLQVYNLFFPLVLVVLLPSLLLRMIRRGGFRAKFGQRLGRYSAEERARWAERRTIWIHSISVGETFVALKLAYAFHAQDPEARVLLSTTTSTGFAEAAKVSQTAGDWLEPVYNPVDAAGIVRRALDAFHPDQLILIEGEAWPNLVAECFRRGIPVSLVNARLSPRSARRFQKFRKWTGPIFRLLDRVAVPEPADVECWASLGVDPARVTCTGSIKFDNPAIYTSREAEFRALLAPLGVTDSTPILVAGSTWAPEEKELAAVLLALRLAYPDLFLVVVPRHVERAAELVRVLEALPLRIVRRTELPAAASQPADILLVDTTGELRDWYALATVVFIGKSLPGIAEVGGQNPAEPAVLGKPVIYGPHMENFGPLVAHLRAREAAFEVSAAAGLPEVIRQLLADPERRTTLGNRAREALAVHAGATARTCDLLRLTPAR